MNREHRLLVFLVGSFVVAGAIEPFAPNPGQPFMEAAWVHSFVIAILCFAWCKAHASVRERSPPPGAALLAAILPPIGIPVYFFRTMPWRQASIATLKALGCFIGAIVLFLASSLLASYIATWVSR